MPIDHVPPKAPSRRRRRLALLFALPALSFAAPSIAGYACTAPYGEFYSWSGASRRCEEKQAEVAPQIAQWGGYIIQTCRLDLDAPWAVTGRAGRFGFTYRNSPGNPIHGNTWDWYCSNSPTTPPQPDKDCGGCAGDGGSGSGSWGGGGGGISKGVGDPIHAATGNVFRVETDYAGNRWLNLRRYYNSSGPVVVDTFGANWRHTYSRSITYTPGTAAGTGTAVLFKEDGREWTFKLSAGTWTTDADIHDTLQSTFDASGNPVSWTNRRADNLQTEYYNAAGKLTSIVDVEGFVSTLSYSDAGTPASIAPVPGLLIGVTDPLGRTLEFAYNAGSRIRQVTQPDGSTSTYTYDGAANLIAVGYPGGAGRSYLYAEPAYGGSASFPAALTGVVDENNSRYSTYEYDTTGRGVATYESTNVNKFQIAFGTPGNSVVTDPLGNPCTYQFAQYVGVWRPTSVSNPCIGNTRYKANAYNVYGDMTSMTDFNNVVTQLRHDIRGLQTARIEAVGTTVQREHRTEWNTTLRLPKTQTVTDANGATVAATSYDYNARGQRIARCEIDWSDATARAYVCSASTAPPAGAKVRRWTYAYCESADVALPGSTCPILGLTKSVNGPRAASDTGMGSVDDVTTYAYYASTDETGCGTVGGTCHRKGDLWTTTNALGHVVENIVYDKNGQLVRTKDTNGTITDLTYHARGWLLTRTVRANASGAASADDATTTFAYAPTGNVTRVTQPDGAYLDYTYDAAHRLTDVVDNLGNRLHYTLDNAGNRIKEETYDTTYNPATPGVGLKRAMSRVYNQLNRLTKTLNASLAPTRDSTAFDATGIDDGYDGNGNSVQFADGLGIETKQAYDPLNRLTQAIQDYLGPDVATSNTTTAYTYDPRDNLRTVVDPDSLTTTYTYDGLNNLIDLDSPDTGHTDYAYDLAGNRTSQTDNRGITSTYTYDRLNRLIAIGYPTTSLDVTFAYDESNVATGCASSFPLGKMTRMTDASGSTTYCYDWRGNVTSKVQVTAGKTLAVGYTYSKADRLMSLTYPSGAIVDYTRDVVGRITGVSWKADALATPITVVSGATYLPFGPLNVLTYGNGRTLTKAYDADYAIDSVASSATDGLKLDFTVDVMGNITAASDTIGAATPTRKYVYDRLYRLSRVDDGADAMQEDYAYNKTGDRTLKQFAGQAAQVYTYLAGTHRLGSVAGVNRTYDANGNTTNRGDGVPLVYDDRNRLAQAGTGTTNSYSHTGRGERVINLRTAPAGTSRQRYAYDEGGLLLATNGYSTTDALIDAAEYVYLDTMPVAQAVNGVLTHLETDHLGTPRVAADRMTNTRQWAWDFFESAFGEHAATGSVDVNLRYPGQVSDGETGLHYNYFRDYEPGTGRYIESDPIGLNGGLGTFTYNDRSALNSIDPFGLSGSVCGAAPTYSPSLWNDGGGMQHTNNCYSYAWDRPNNPPSQPPRPYPCRPQPGGFNCNSPPALDCESIIKLAIQDGMTKTDSIGRCPSCYHKVFLVIAPEVDYHWYRQDNDRTWSHKPGFGPATNEDASGNPIPNPESANRNYGKANYSQRCGYLCAPNR